MDPADPDSAYVIPLVADVGDDGVSAPGADEAALRQVVSEARADGLVPARGGCPSSFQRRAETVSFAFSVAG